MIRPLRLYGEARGGGVTSPARPAAIPCANSLAKGFEIDSILLVWEPGMRKPSVIFFHVESRLIPEIEVGIGRRIVMEVHEKVEQQLPPEDCWRYILALAGKQNANAGLTVLPVQLSSGGIK
jgi:hypothetical protein